MQAACVCVQMHVWADMPCMKAATQHSSRSGKIALALACAIIFACKALVDTADGNARECDSVQKGIRG